MPVHKIISKTCATPLSEFKVKVLDIEAGNNEIVDYYGVKALPLFILLDKKGSVLYLPERMPSENAEYRFMKIMDMFDQKR